MYNIYFLIRSRNIFRKYISSKHVAKQKCWRPKLVSLSPRITPFLYTPLYYTGYLETFRYLARSPHHYILPGTASGLVDDATYCSMRVVHVQSGHYVISQGHAV